MNENGRRNVALLTVAPTGSVSICTQTTSGIEPVFQPAYSRRRKVNPNDKLIATKKIVQDSNGDSFEVYNVLHPKFKIWLELNGYKIDEVEAMSDEEIAKIIEKTPYYKATAYDIDWVDKVKMQGAIQKWVDHSISVTVNIPKDTTQEMVSKIYQTAWESGCKGCTIYRDGSRDGVLISREATKGDDCTTFKETKAPKRPKKLEAEIKRFTNDKEKWIAVVGMYEGRPYEIFTGKEDSFVLPKWVEKGWVIRTKEEGKKARYDFEFLDKDGYAVNIQGLSRMFNQEYWNYAKLISGILRHGMPIPNVVDLISKLNFDVDSITTWKNGVARALKQYIKNGTDAGEKCPECGEELVFEDGCKHCRNCGYSKCG